MILMDNFENREVNMVKYTMITRVKTKRIFKSIRGMIAENIEGANPFRDQIISGISLNRFERGYRAGNFSS